MEIWIIFAFLHAIVRGFLQCSKKKALEKNSVYEILAYMSLISFVLVAFSSKNVFDIGLINLILILIKSLITVVVWLTGLYALDKMPVSLYSITNLSKMIFSIILSLIFLGEKLTITVTIGIIIVLIGLILVNLNNDKKSNKEAELKIILVLLFSCMLASISEIIDKKILMDINSGQLQFWFLLFLTIIYFIILLIKNRKINLKNISRNYWIPLCAILMAVADRFMFLAAEVPESKIIIISIIKQFTTIESIILGKIIFKDKKIIKKLLCSLLIIFGIVLTLI